MNKDINYDAVANNEGTHKDEIKKPKGIGVRHIQMLVLFVSLSVAYAIRTHLSISIVGMSLSDRLNISCSPIEEELSANITEMETDDPCNKEAGVYRVYRWEKSKQEMVLFAFFVGYTTMMIPGGILAQKFGGKIPIMVALFTNGCLSLVTPWMAMVGGWQAVCACRLVQGLSQAAILPSIHTMLAKWVPFSERGRLSTYVYIGSQAGAILAFQLAGYFAGSPKFGWPMNFWFFGGLCLVSFGLLWWLGSANPYDHPRITSEELMFISGMSNADLKPKKRPVPWKKILTTKASWGIYISHIGSAQGLLFTLTQTPLYMSSVLGVDLKHNGLYSSLPYIMMGILNLCFGYLSDYLIVNKYLSILNVRRIFNTIGMFVAGIFLLAFPFVRIVGLAVTLLVLSLGLHAGIYVGFHINHIDIAPNFAGSVMSLGNMVANLCGLMVPVMVSNILNNDATNVHRWQILCVIMFSIMTISNFIYIFFAKGEVQPWNYSQDEQIDDFKKRESIVLLRMTERKQSMMSNHSKILSK